MLIMLCASSCSKSEPNDSKLVILHTNDTHSQILPTDRDLGGVMRRMAVIDSIRGEYPNVLLVDAGDVVQGSLFFYLYGGEVEQQLINAMGVDESILGNHEFDNGVDSLASVLRLRNHKLISSNYAVEGTPLDSLTVPYSVRSYKGKKIGVMGINLDPNEIIAAENYRGVEFRPIIETANATAEYLRNNEGADAVIALTHIGYGSDYPVGDSLLAANSRGIDIIIGGHSHTAIDPADTTGRNPYRIANLDGKDVLVTQTGKSGVNIGKIVLDLDSLGASFPQYELIPVTNRYDSYRNEEIEQIIARYKPGVDSLMTLYITNSENGMEYRGNEIQNFFADFVLERGRQLSPGVELAIANKGGLRTALPADSISKGHIINLVPFRNVVVVVDVPGDSLLSIFRQMGSTFGNAVSANVRGTYRQLDDKKSELVNVSVNGRTVDPRKTYRIATIDYLAEGNDYMTGFKGAPRLQQSPSMVYDDMIEYITESFGNRPLSADTTARWIPEE